MRVSETRHKTNVIESGKGIILQSTIPVTSLVPQLSLGSNLWVLSSPQPPNLTTYREKKKTPLTRKHRLGTSLISVRKLTVK